MQVTSILMLALSTLSAAAPALVARDGATIVADIGAISSGVNNVNSKVTAFNGNAIQALGILTASGQLSNAIKKGSTDAGASAPLSEDESSAVAGAVLDLQPNINTVLQNLVSKKPQFQKALFGFSATPIVVSTLKGLRQETTYLGGNITAKLTPDFAAIAPTVIKEIDDAFVAAIGAFA